MSRTWTVYKEDRSFYVRDLFDPDDQEFNKRHGLNPDRMLLYFYPDGDVDSPYDAEKMLRCLYDLYQVNDIIKEGDRFETPFGKFFCWSFHVSPMEDYNDIMRKLWCPVQLTLQEQENILDSDQMWKDYNARLAVRLAAKEVAKETAQ